MNKEPVISLQNVGVRFGYRKSFFKHDVVEALRDVSLKLYHGDSLGVIGKNGAGKSTLLSLLGGIILPDSGKIISKNVKTSLLALQVGFDPELSGRTNAILSGMLLGFQYEQVKANLDKIIAFSELGEFIDWNARARELKLHHLMLKEVVMKRRIHENNQGRYKRAHTKDYLRVLKAALDRRKGKKE